MSVLHLKEKRSAGVTCFSRRVVEWKTLGSAALVDLRTAGSILAVCGSVVTTGHKLDGLIFWQPSSKQFRNFESSLLATIKNERSRH